MKKIQFFSSSMMKKYEEAYLDAQVRQLGSAAWAGGVICHIAIDSTATMSINRRP
jgi:hypothetical protein